MCLLYFAVNIVINRSFVLLPPMRPSSSPTPHHRAPYTWSYMSYVGTSLHLSTDFQLQNVQKLLDFNVRFFIFMITFQISERVMVEWKKRTE